MEIVMEEEEPQYSRINREFVGMGKVLAEKKRIRGMV